MSAQTQTQFDLELLAKSFENWDLETLMRLYHDELEQIEIDEVTPPSAPRVRTKEELRQIYTNGRAAGVRVTIENTVMGEDRAACTFTCWFDDSRRVVANSILDL